MGICMKRVLSMGSLSKYFTSKGTTLLLGVQDMQAANDPILLSLCGELNVFIKIVNVLKKCVYIFVSMGEFDIGVIQVSLTYS